VTAPQIERRKMAEPFRRVADTEESVKVSWRCYMQTRAELVASRGTRRLVLIEELAAAQQAWVLAQTAHQTAQLALDTYLGDSSR
jgi:hypothetical protein